MEKALQNFNEFLLKTFGNDKEVEVLIASKLKNKKQNDLLNKLLDYARWGGQGRRKGVGLIILDWKQLFITADQEMFLFEFENDELGGEEQTQLIKNLHVAFPSTKSTNKLAIFYQH